MKKIRLKKLLIPLLTFALLLSVLPGMALAADAADESELRAAIEAGGEVTVNGDITITQPLTVTRDVTIAGNGTLRLASDWTETSIALITVSEGAKLTVDGITIDGNGENIATNYGAGSACAIDVKGELVLNSGAIRNFINNSSSTANIIYINSGSFTMNGGTIDGNRLNSGNYHGIVYISEGGAFTLENGIISGNYVADPQGASGVVNVSNHDGENTFVMNGGYISDNESTGVYAGSNSSNEQAGGKAEFTMNDGFISGNTYGTSYYSGGVYIVNGEVTMNGGSIENNEGQFYGGGVAVVANPEGTFIMNDGSIKGNKSMYGGGIYVTSIQNTAW